MLHYHNKRSNVNFDLKMPKESHIVNYFIDTKIPRPYCIVCPGGGYSHLASHEGEDIARWLNKQGIHAGVFYYQVNPVDKIQLLQDIENLFLYLNEYIVKNIIAKDKIATIGFSAGGHVASLMGTISPVKPNLMLLCYPVISFLSPYAHRGSRDNFLKDEIDEKTSRTYSGELNVTFDTPPTFIWHTADDSSVPVQNSLNFATALSKNNIPFDLHIFESGRHGLGLSSENPHCMQWNTLAINWFKKHKFI